MSHQRSVEELCPVARGNRRMTHRRIRQDTAALEAAGNEPTGFYLAIRRISAMIGYVGQREAATGKLDL